MYFTYDTKNVVEIYLFSHVFGSLSCQKKHCPNFNESEIILNC